MKYLVLFASIVALIAFGIWYTTPPAPQGKPGLINRNQPVDYKAVPDGYQSVNPSLYRKPLSLPQPGSDMAFQTVSNSGIDFQNEFDRKRPVELIDTGAGVAIGDYDNDGLPDVYLVGSDVGNRLYRNKGNFEFEDLTEFANVDGSFAGKNLWGSGATFADVENDGDLDLYVCNMAGPNLLYINQGDGTFEEQSYLRGCNYTGASKSANFCDFDRDGDLDIYLVTYQDKQPDASIDPVEMVDGKKRIRKEYRDQYMLVGDGVVKSGEADILYRNNGDGTFEEITEEAGLVDYGTSLAAVWLDYDNDGWFDIYVSNDFHSPDRLFRNNGDGTFSDILPQVAKHTPWFSMGNDAADVNRDGLVDIFTSDMAGTSHYRRKVDMGDMGDSAFFLTYGAPRQYMKNAFFINSGMGPALEVAGLTGTSSTDWTWSPRLIDMDNDGNLDLFVSNGHIRDIMNADVVAKIETIGKKGTTSQLEEFYAQIPVRKEKNLAFKNLGGLEFQPVGEKWNLDLLGVSHGASFSDLDLDGDLDLIVNNLFETASVYRNESNSGNRLLFEFRCNRNNFYGVGTRVELWYGNEYQMKTLRSTRGYLSSDAPQIHFGCGQAKVIDRVRITWPDQSVEELYGINTNYLHRVIEGNSKPGSAIEIKNQFEPEPESMFVDATTYSQLEFRHREREYDDFAREKLLPYKLSELGGGLAWGDVNQDGRPDLFCGGAAGQPGALFVNQKDGKFKQTKGPWKDDSESEDMGIHFFDADGDQDLDLYVVSGGNECQPNDPVLRDRLYLNDGNGNFEKSSDGLPNLDASGSVVISSDFDQDGDLDLFVGGRSIPGQYPLTPTSYLLVNDNGNFQIQTEDVAIGLSKVGLVNSATWSDFDLDGWPDLIVALEWGPVKVFRNQNGKLIDHTAAMKLDQHLGWWRSIQPVDLDDDGDLDYVVTNQGLNTKYHADKKHPHRLYYSDFDNNGELDLVETEFEGDVEFPARGRSCSSNSMPFIKEKFETYHEFALASLMDVYEPDISKKPVKEVNFLESAILWNELNNSGENRGRAFRLEPLHRLAQISPAFGMAAGDFNGDSKTDLFLANNFFASQAETGFMDGGLSWLMLGSNAGLKPAWPKRSGIAIPSAAYGAAAADYDRDGDLDIAVGINNENFRLLANQTGKSSSGPKSMMRLVVQSSAHPLWIRLKGSDFQRIIQPTGGGSYLSQSWEKEILVSRKLLKKVSEIEVQWADGHRSTVRPPNGTDEPIVLAP